MPLFKYVTLDRIDILVNQEIRYTQLGAFNDPFEFPLFLEKVLNFSTWESQYDEKFLNSMRVEYEMLSDEVKLRMPFDVFLMRVRERTVPALTQHFERKNDEVILEAREILRQSAQLSGGLSLTETPDNLLMWAHYSGQHTGMVIEVDELHSIFDERRSLQDDLRYLREVAYLDIRPICKTLEDFSYADYMLTKSNEWSYEKEWRIAKTVADAKRIIPDSPYDICLFHMPAIAIKRVILGARVNPEDRDRIKNILRTTPHLDHVRLQQASLDERRFALNFVDY